jgi:hypothetical protein
VSAPPNSFRLPYPGDPQRFPTEAQAWVVPKSGDFVFFQRFLQARQEQKAQWVVLERKLTRAFRVELGKLSSAVARAEWLAGCRY